MVKKSIKLVCLTSGNKKDGSGKWFKATFLGHDKDGAPIKNDFFIDADVGERMINDGIVEDVVVNVEMGFDDYLRPSVTNVTKASGNAVPSKEV